MGFPVIRIDPLQLAGSGPTVADKFAYIQITRYPGVEPVFISLIKIKPFAIRGYPYGRFMKIFPVDWYTDRKSFLPDTIFLNRIKNTFIILAGKRIGPGLSRYRSLRGEKQNFFLVAD
jgi:hypothetical protein